MTNAIPKIYNEQTNEWVELMAKPIAKEVVQIMKEDFMKNKGPIKLLELPYGYNEKYDVYDYSYYIFYNSKESQQNIDIYGGSLKNIIIAIYDSLPEKRELTYNDLKQDNDFNYYEKFILGFNVIYQDDFGSSVVFSSKDTSSLDLKSIVNAVNFTVSYIFNDNPVEENQYKHTV